MPGAHGLSERNAKFINLDTGSAMNNIVLGFLAPILLGGLWWATAAKGWLPEQLLPAPGLVRDALVGTAKSGDLWADTLIGLQCVAEGFGCPAGVAFDGAIEAVFLADRVIVLKPHPGRVAWAVEVELGPHRDRSDPAFVRLRDEVLETLDVRHGAREIIFSV